MGKQTAGDANGGKDAAEFRDLKGIAVDPETKLLFVTDQGNSKIKYIATSGTPTTTSLSIAAVTGGDITFYEGLADKFLYAIAGNQIMKVTITNILSPSMSVFAGTAGPGFGTGNPGNFFQPQALTVAKTGKGAPNVLTDGTLLVADTSNNQLRIVSTTGTVAEWSGLLQENTQVNQDDACNDPVNCGNPPAYTNINGVTLDDQDQVYITDTGSGAFSVRKIDKDGFAIKTGKSEKFLTGTSQVCDGTHNEALFVNPKHIEYDSEGFLIVLDEYRIRRIIILPDGNGVVDTLAGTSTSAFLESGTGVGFTFLEPQSIEIFENSVYVACKTHIMKLDFQPPSAPAAPTVLEYTSSTLSIKYGTSSFDGGVIFHNYTLIVRQQDNGFEITENIFPSLNYTTEIETRNFTGLVPGKVYEIYSFAANRVGKSISTIVTVTTPLYCEGVYFTTPGICSGHGSCLSTGQCSCSSGFYGNNCTVTECYGTLSNDTSVCNNHGTCTQIDTCSCNSGYTASQCDIIICDNVLSNETNVCSSHGTCTAPDSCNCVENYVGSNCSEPVCFGKNATDTQSCNGTGICISANTCSCSSGYEGSNCDVVNCFGVLSNQSTVCSGHGSCQSPDSCQCITGYTGNNCQYIVCGTNHTGMSIVCSNHGTCSAPDVCDCTTNYVGSECELPVCFGKNSENTTVCSTNGTCIAPDTCICKNGFVGNECETMTCFGVAENDPNVCDGRGNCVTANGCICEENYIGDNCNITTCLGFLSTDPNVCGNQGQCNSYDICSCNNNYFGPNCSVTICSGVLSNDTNVCNNHGSCISPENCQCTGGYSGTNCNEFQCYGIASTSASVCAGHGACSSPNSCNCSTGYEGNSCDYYYCQGVLFNSSLICSGNGTCTSPDTCVCNTGYGGNDCSQFACFGISATNTSVCSGHGACVKSDICSCNSSDYTGSDCGTWNCFGTANNLNPCNNGTCIDIDSCLCSDGYFGQTCDTWNCSGIAVNSGLACSNHGQCIGPDVCLCYEGYFGENCSSFNCFGIGSTNTSACSGHGNCVASDECSCATQYAGTTCSNSICYGISGGNSTVCSGHGSCIGFDTCDCQNGYSGSQCDDFSCFGISISNPNVCSGNGSCVATDTCSCSSEYINQYCNLTLGNSITLHPNLGEIVVTPFEFQFPTSVFTTPFEYSTFFIHPETGKTISLAQKTSTNAIYPPVLGLVKVGANITTQFGQVQITRFVKVFELSPTSTTDKETLLETGSTGSQNLENYYQRSCSEETYLANLIRIYSAVNISYECKDPVYKVSSAHETLYSNFERNLISNVAPRCSLSALFQDTPLHLKTTTTTLYDAEALECISRNTQDPDYGLNHLQSNVLVANPIIFQSTALELIGKTLSNYLSYLLSQSSSRSFFSNIQAQNQMKSIMSTSTLLSRLISLAQSTKSPVMNSIETPNIYFAVIKDDVSNLIGRSYAIATPNGTTTVRFPSQFNIASSISTHFTYFYHDISQWKSYDVNANISSIVFTLEIYEDPVSQTSLPLTLNKLAQPFTISIPGSFDTTLTVDKEDSSKDRYDYVCKYFDASSETWEIQADCDAVSTISGSSGTCSCSSFQGPLALSLQYYPGTPVTCEDGFTLIDGECQRNPQHPFVQFLADYWYYILAGLLLLLLLCCMFYCFFVLCLLLLNRRRRTKKQKETKIDPIHLNLIKLLQSGDWEIDISEAMDKEDRLEHMQDHSSEDHPSPLPYAKTPVEVIGVRLHDHKDMFSRFKVPKSSTPTTHHVIETTIEKRKKKKPKKKKGKIAPIPLPEEPKKKTKRIVIFRFKDGFIVDYGRFRTYTSPQNCEFMRSVVRGVIPEELHHREDADLIYFSVVKINKCYIKQEHDERRRYHQKPMDKSKIFVNLQPSSSSISSSSSSSQPKISYVEEHIISSVPKSSQLSQRSRNQIVRSEIFASHPADQQKSLWDQFVQKRNEEAASNGMHHKHIESNKFPRVSPKKSSSPPKSYHSPSRGTYVQLNEETPTSPSRETNSYFYGTSIPSVSLSNKSSSPSKRSNSKRMMDTSPRRSVPKSNSPKSNTKSSTPKPNTPKPRASNGSARNFRRYVKKKRPKEPNLDSVISEYESDTLPIPPTSPKRSNARNPRF